LGVTALSPSDIWAVGANGQTLTEHWNGSSWSVVSSPSPGSSYNYLNGVTAISSSDVWAVGYQRSGFTNATLVERYNDPGCATPTPSGPTNTPAPTNTPSGPTNTPAPTNTPLPTSTPQPTVCPNPFVDINSNIFFHAINYLYCHGVVNGTDPTHYSPAGTSTRGQFAKVVVLGFGTPFYTPSGGQTFTDVPPGYFAYTFIETGYHAGILSGYDQAGCASHGATYPCYLPNIPITRGQLTKLVVGAAHYPLFTPTGGTQTFSDVPPSNVFFVSIETAHNKGVINGYPDGTFRPNNNIRRDEMAQIVYKGVTTP
jgi:S-layer homology domain